MATDSKSEGICCICQRRTFAIHHHHTVPRSCNGENSLQIPLCGQCHTTLHAQGSYVIAKLRRHVVESKQFWNTFEEEVRAKPYLDILVTAIMTYSGHDRQHVITIKVPSKIYALLKRLKLDLNCSSLLDTVLSCIVYTAKSRGLNIHQED